MLSNKLTFSLASLIIILALVLASTSAMAAFELKIEDASTERAMLAVKLTSNQYLERTDWNLLKPALMFMDKAGEEVTSSIAFANIEVAALADDAVANNVTFTSGELTADEITARSAKVTIAADLVRSGDRTERNPKAEATITLLPIIEFPGTLEIKGAEMLSPVYELSFVVTNIGATAPTTALTVMDHITFTPTPDVPGTLSEVDTDTEANTHTYTLLIRPKAGSTGLRVEVDPGYIYSMPLEVGYGVAPATTADALGAKKFRVFTANGETGIDDSVDRVVDDSLVRYDLNDILRLGGTIEVMLPVGPKGSTTHTVVSDMDKAADITADVAAKAAYKLIITEVMWGLNDESGGSQWIEVYNNGAVLKASDSVKLMVHKNVRQSRIGEKVTMGDNTYVVTDFLSTIDRFGDVWTLKGQSGYPAEGVGTDRIPAKDLISMYRKVALDAGVYKAKADAKINDVVTGLDGLGDGSVAGSWEASGARTNMSGHYSGSPGAVHVTHGGVAGINKGFDASPASFSATGVIINEVRNDPSDANLDWVELYHYNDAAGATPQSLENWTLSLVTRTPKTGKTETDDPTDGNFAYADTNLFSLPKIKLQPGEYLVIYNRDPGDTILAGGVSVEDVLAGKQVNKGATHQYIVREGLNIPATGKFLLLLRNGNDKAGTHEKLVDYAGNGFFKRVETNKFNTDVWPFIAWNAPGDVDNADFGGDNTFASANQSFGRNVTLTDKGMYRPNSGANRVHKDHWQSFEFMGTGYDREVDPRTAPGTPGYENRNVNVISDDREGATGKTAYNFGGTVTISEIMYDAGPRWNLIQWIELYNSSMTETVNLEGWTMEIRNESTDVESYVDSSFKFEAGTEILPNQTLLVVSGTGANDVPQGRVYNLFEHHRRQLGLTARSSRLLSREGFYIRLTSKIMQNGREKDIEDLDARDISLILMDEVGNVEVDGAARVHQWDLPPRDPAARQSLVRVYGSGANARKIDGTRDAASDGQMMESWKQSDITGAALTFYGHRDDIGTPGYRLGGPLPVQLSSFRPVRDKATGHVAIRWITQSELNNAGFNILRSAARVGPYEVVNLKGMIPGHGTTSEKHVYEWKDTTAKPNVVYYYQIEDVSLDGNRTRLATTRLKGHISAGGKLTTTWSDLKTRR